MKYWKEKENNPVEKMEFWQGTTITKLAENEIFVMGTNPSGIHGAGAAKAGLKFGAKMTVGRGLMGSTYGLITKNLEGKAGFVEKETGIVYDKEGYRSVSTEQIRGNIEEMYAVAKQPEHQNKKFLVTYQYESWPNGTPKKSLNGYTSQEMLEMFVKDQNIPPNIVFHESYKPHIDKLLNKKNKVLNVLPNLIVISPREKAPEDFTVINTTSKDVQNVQNIGKQFSPFFLSNISIYDGIVAKNMENAWQFTKVYKEFTDENNNPTQAYFDWAKKGWDDTFAHRYANGKGNIPLYSYWKTKDKKSGELLEHKWDYITARKNIYFPLYAKAIVNTQAFKDLQKRVLSGEKIVLWDFDGYNHAARNMTYEEVVNEPKYKCGHAFVLYGLLTKQLKIINDELIYDFNLTLKDDNKMNNIIENKPKGYTYFFHLTSPFSNFHPAKFEYKGLTFISNEQFMMYSKAKTFKDEETANKILNIFNEFQIEPGVFKDMSQKLCFQISGGFKNGQITRDQILADKESIDAWNTIHKRIKQLGREVKNYDDTVWSERRFNVVLFGAREKFSQNEDLRNTLMKTGDTIMIEASPYDRIWGIGLSATDAKKKSPSEWPGLNLLGKVLDQLKEEFSLKNINTNDDKLDPNIEVKNFYHLGKKIPEDGVYIGRASKAFSLEKSIFANPFPMKDQSEEERNRVVAEYKKWIWQEVLEQRITKEDLLSLKDKKLVCYCNPKSCHGDVLKALVEYIINNEADFDAKIQAYQNKNKMKP